MPSQLIQLVAPRPPAPIAALVRLCAMLSRPRAGAALALALLFGVAEPALCILHCQLWLPAAASHAAHHSGHAHLAPSGAPSEVVAALRVAGASCFMHRGAAPDAPAQLPPSPVREAALLALALLAPILCITPAARPASAALPFRWPDPPLRPPARPA